MDYKPNLYYCLVEHDSDCYFKTFAWFESMWFRQAITIKFFVVGDNCNIKTKLYYAKTTKYHDARICLKLADRLGIILE